MATRRLSECRLHDVAPLPGRDSARGSGTVYALERMAPSTASTLHDLITRQRRSQMLMHGKSGPDEPLAANHLLSITEDGVWDWSVDTDHVAFSDRWCTMLGYEPHEVAPHVDSWKAAVHPDDWPVILASLEPQLRGETPQYICEHRVRRKDGTWLWIMDRGKVVERAPDGRPLRMMGTHTDVTWRRAAEDANARARRLALGQARILELIAGGAELSQVLGEIAAFVAQETDAGTNPDELALVTGQLSTLAHLRARDEDARAVRESDQQFLTELTGRLQQSRTVRERGEQALRLLAGHLGVPACGWLTINASAGTFTVEQEILDGKFSGEPKTLPLSAWLPFTHASELRVIVDTAADPRISPIQEEAFAMLGHRASLAHGVFRADQWVGVIYANDTRPRDWLEREQQLLTAAAERIWSALDVARALEDTDRERRRLQATLDALPVGVVITDAHGEFAYVNDRVSEIWGGAPHADAIGEYAQYRGWWVHNDKPIAAEDWALARAITRGETSRRELIRIARFDGRFATALNAAAPIRNEAGEIIGAVVVIEDVTEQVQLADTNEQLRESSRRKSAFVSYLSHELRTPLNAILGFSELLHDDVVGPVSELQRDVLVDVLSSGRHILRLLDDILDTARIEAGKLELRVEPVEVGPFIDDVLATYKPLAAARRLQLSLEVAPGIRRLVFPADPSRVRQVLYNYLTNAIKFTPEGGKIQVRVECTANAMLRFVVSDTGMGISSEDRARLFLDFEQLDLGISRGGWGLGLALARRLVEAHHGHVGVDSTPGQGSSFWAEYPLAGEPAV